MAEFTIGEKPDKLPRWANDGGELAEPTEGEKDIGWEKGKEPPHGYMNWLLFYLYAWAAYLADGALEGNHSIDGDLTVTGETKTDTLVVEDKVEGDLVVEGDVYHGERTLVLHASAALLSNAGTADAEYDDDGSGSWRGGDGVSVLHLPIPLRPGDRITKAVVWVRHETTANNSMSASARAGDPSDGSSTTVLSGKSTSSGDYQTLEWEGSGDGLPLVLAEDRHYFLSITVADEDGSRFLGAKVTYDRPKPAAE